MKGTWCTEPRTFKQGVEVCFVRDVRHALRMAMLVCQVTGGRRNALASPPSGSRMSAHPHVQRRGGRGGLPCAAAAAPVAVLCPRDPVSACAGAVRVCTPSVRAAHAGPSGLPAHARPMAAQGRSQLARQGASERNRAVVPQSRHCELPGLHM